MSGHTSVVCESGDADVLQAAARAVGEEPETPGYGPVGTTSFSGAPAAGDVSVAVRCGVVEQAWSLVGNDCHIDHSIRLTLSSDLPIRCPGDFRRAVPAAPAPRGRW